MLVSKVYWVNRVRSPERLRLLETVASFPGIGDTHRRPYEHEWQRSKEEDERTVSRIAHDKASKNAFLFERRLAIDPLDRIVRLSMVTEDF